MNITDYTAKYNRLSSAIVTVDELLITVKELYALLFLQVDTYNPFFDFYSSLCLAFFAIDPLVLKYNRLNEKSSG